MKSTSYLSAILLSGILSGFSYGQENSGIQDTLALNSKPDTSGSSEGYDFFSSDELLKMTLCFDIQKLIRNKEKPSYMDATLTVNINDSSSLTQQIKLKARGNMRRTYCTFPPLMLKFNDRDDESEMIRSGCKLKLVTHCNSTPVSEKYILKEYLVYLLYRQLTEYSFKTRLVEVSYVDVNKPGKTSVKYGFLVEDEDQMAERIHADLVNNPNLSLKHMNSADMLRFAIFNYMIGNTDWSLPGQHNVKVLSSPGMPASKGIPVAYDFDYSGFVNASYAVPTERLPLVNVTERYYLGLCSDDGEVNPIMDEFEELKGQFLDTIEDFDFLSEGERKQSGSYINSFYKMFTNRSHLINEFHRTCKLY